MSKNEAKSPFEGYEEAKIDSKKWDYEKIPAIFGTFKSVKTITMQDETKFDVYVFENCINAENSEPLGLLEVPSMAKIKAFLTSQNNGIGGTYGIWWKGKEKHPTDKKKTVNLISIYVADEAKAKEIAVLNSGGIGGENSDLPW